MSGLTIFQLCDVFMKKIISLGSINIDCSVEVGFIDTFFSSSNPELGNVVFEEKTTDELDTFLFGKESYSIQATDEYSSDSRTLQLVFNESVSLMDIVQRFVIEKSAVEYIDINEKRHFHKRNNFYYQYPAQCVEIKFKDGSDYVFNPSFECNIAGLIPFVYVRDEPDKWIFHVRLQSMKPDKYVIKGCTSYYNKPFPNFVQKFCSFLGLMQPTLYVRERYSQRIPFQTNGANDISIGSEIIIHTTWEKVSG